MKISWLFHCAEFIYERGYLVDGRVPWSLVLEGLFVL